MKIKGFLCFLLLTVVGKSVAQELNCDVTVNASRTAQTNTQMFKALQTSIRDFMNNTKFSNIDYGKGEKIDCYISVDVSSYDNNQFTVLFRVGSSRPVFNSNYKSPVFNFTEESATFSYIEFEPIVYSENSYTTELSAILSFYAHMIIGLDADTFSLNGGNDAFQKASAVVNFAQASSNPSWQQGSEINNRYFLLNDILSSNFSAYREALYNYHRKGMDMMADDSSIAKTEIFSALKILEKNHRVRPNNFPNRIFFDAKVDEIINVYSAGPEFDKQPLVDLLNSINPTNSMKWYRL